MNEELSPKMISAIKHMARNENTMVRFPGGYWARRGWSAWNGPCFGTSTIEAIVRRGYAEYTVWKDGRGNTRFPIECGLTKRAAGRLKIVRVYDESDVEETSVGEYQLKNRRR